MKFNDEFPVLSIVSILVIVMGWLVVVVGVVLLLINIIKGLDYWSDERWIGLLASVSFACYGLFQVAIGEAIGVLFSIEKNTADTASAMVNLSNRVGQMAVRQSASPSVTSSEDAGKSVVGLPKRPTEVLKPRTCPSCRQRWEYGEECPDCGVKLEP